MTARVPVTNGTKQTIVRYELGGMIAEIQGDATFQYAPQTGALDTVVIKHVVKRTTNKGITTNEWMNTCIPVARVYDIWEVVK